MQLSRRPGRDEAGFTVVELLVVMFVLSVVVAATLLMIQVVVRQGNGVAQRTDAMQRGRLALDTITRQVRSQVCLNAATGSMVAASSASLTFYADLGDGSAPPTRRTLTYDPATSRITQSVIQGTGPANGPYLFTAPPTSTVLLEDVVADGGAPVFDYYAYPSNGGPNPSQRLVPPLSATDLSRTARIRIRFAVRPSGARDDRFATSLQDELFMRTANPNAARPDPTCQ
jgi:prepilin-type N-terminal cleavage/methylation domain-containing protein